MVDFSNDIPKGRPQIDPQFFNKKVAKKDDLNSIITVNTNFALKNLSDVSIFKGDK